MKYDEQIEVTKEQYSLLLKDVHLSGVIAHREEDGKYYFKVWYSKYIPYIKRLLK